MDKERHPYEVKRILEQLDSVVLSEFASLENTKYFETIQGFCKRYAHTKKGDILLDLNLYDPQRLAVDVSFKKGEIYAIGVLLDVIKGAKKELIRRKED